MSEGHVVVPFLQPTKKIEPFAPRVSLISSFAGQDPEPIEYIVDGLIPKRSVTLLAGRSGVGKTMLCQMMMTACAFGRPWIARETRRCKSFGVFAEDEAVRLHERQKRICEHYEVEMLDFEEQASVMADDDKDFTLYECARRWTPGAPTFLWQQLAKHVKDNGIELVILDNVGVVFRGDRWSDNQVRDFVRFFNGQARALNCAIVVLVHPPKARDSYFAGSQAWENTVRQAISLDYIDGDERSQELILKLVNANYTPHSDPLRFGGLTMKWEQGVLVPRDEGGYALNGNVLGFTDKLALDNKLVDAVHKMVEKGWKVAADPGSPNYLVRQLWKQRQWKERVNWEQIVSALDRTIGDGRIVKAAVGGKWMLRTPEDRYLGEESP